MIGKTRFTKWVLSKGCMPCQTILPLFARRRGMPYKWGGGCINTYLRNPICSTHSLACKTFSHPMAWWIYQQVDLWCLHSQCKYPLFVGNLLWNGGGYQCALFLHVKPDYWLTWLHCHCHIAMDFLELDSKVIQGGFHSKNLCTTTTGGYVFDFGG